MRPFSIRSVFHVKHFRQYILLLALIVLASGCTLSRNPVSGRKRAYAYTWEQEKQLGAQADQQIQAAYGLYDDEELARYVDRVGQAVLARSDLREPDTAQEFRETEFTFRVLDSPVVNAFALPGGYVYVTRGLLAHANNEAQLAVVLGHEIGHVAARHASQRALEQQLGQLVLLGGAIAGQELLNLPAQDLLNLGSTAAQLMFLKYSRDDERESDNLGVEYAAKAGYAASEGSEFFRSLERIGEQQGEGIPSWLSSHPDPGEREETITELAAQWNEQFEMNRVEQEDLYNQIAGMVIGENPRQGFTENGVFYHPELRFQFPVPRGFRVINQPTQVGMIDEQQQAIEVFSIAQQSSAQAAAQQFAGQQGIQVVESGPTQSNGLQAYYIIADAQTQQGQVVRLLNYNVEYGGNVYTFVGYSARNNFSTYQNEFQRSMQGFAPVTDRRILNVQPVRTEIERASRTAPFEAFVPSRLPSDVTPLDLAIMNQVEMNAQIPSGMLLKLPTE